MKQHPPSIKNRATGFLSRLKERGQLGAIQQIVKYTSTWGCLVSERRKRLTVEPNGSTVHHQRGTFE
jgi:hypothetical protein